MRFSSMAELRSAISPDVIVEGEPDFIRRMAKATKEGKPTGVPTTNNLENSFRANWERLGGPALTEQYVFHPSRKWRYDFCLPKLKIAFEIQGGLAKAKSGHRSQEGVERDCEKLNESLILGWKVFHITTKMVQDAALIKRLIDFVAKQG